MYRPDSITRTMMNLSRPLGGPTPFSENVYKWLNTITSELQSIKESIVTVENFRSELHTIREEIYDIRSTLKGVPKDCPKDNENHWVEMTYVLHSKVPPSRFTTDYLSHAFQEILESGQLQIPLTELIERIEWTSSETAPLQALQTEYLNKNIRVHAICLDKVTDEGEFFNLPNKDTVILVSPKLLQLTPQLLKCVLRYCQQEQLHPAIDLIKTILKSLFSTCVTASDIILSAAQNTEMFTVEPGAIWLKDCTKWDAIPTFAEPVDASAPPPQCTENLLEEMDEFLPNLQVPFSGLSSVMSACKYLGPPILREQSVGVLMWLIKRAIALGQLSHSKGKVLFVREEDRVPDRPSDKPSAALVQDQICFVQCFHHEFFAGQSLMVNQANNFFQNRLGGDLVRFRTHGYTKLRDFIAEIPGLGLFGSGNLMEVRMTNAAKLKQLMAQASADDSDATDADAELSTTTKGHASKPLEEAKLSQAQLPPPPPPAQQQKQQQPLLTADQQQRQSDALSEAFVRKVRQIFKNERNGVTTQMFAQLFMSKHPGECLEAPGKSIEEVLLMVPGVERAGNKFVWRNRSQRNEQQQIRRQNAPRRPQIDMPGDNWGNVEFAQPPPCPPRPAPAAQGWRGGHYAQPHYQNQYQQPYRRQPPHMFVPQQQHVMSPQCMPMQPPADSFVHEQWKSKGQCDADTATPETAQSPNSSTAGDTDRAES